MYSIYHFFNALYQKKDHFKRIKRLDRFPFDQSLLSCRNEGVFPDLAIRLNKKKGKFTGGELIELKDRDSYTISSFNSTIPSRSKNIDDIITSDNSTVKKQMEEAGDKISSLKKRDVFYLVRGRKKQNVKVCLVYGSFFETISIESLISESFSQVIEERLKEIGKDISPELRESLLSIFSAQQNFSKVRTAKKASVKLRFRIMTEVKSEGNILNSKKYPQIKDNTLNFILPCHNETGEKETTDKFKSIFGRSEIKQFEIFKIKHHFNGYFLVFQTKI
ncbi:MAG: hypothetical protein AB1521_16245 [Bacteroidota bacterium]